MTDNRLELPIGFRIRALPDANHPRHLATFGQQAQQATEQVVFNGLMTLASNPAANNNLVMTLRYFLDSQREARDRLHLHLLLSSDPDPGQNPLDELALRTAANIWQAQLQSCLELERLAPYSTERLDRFWERDLTICHLVKRTFVQKDKSIIYVPWPYKPDSRASAPDVLFWDRLLHALSEFGDADCYCVDLVFRPIRLAPGNKVQASLEFQLKKAGSRTSFGDLSKRVYQEYWELCAQGALFEFGMSVAGTDGDKVKWLTGGLGTGLTCGGRFDVASLESGSPAYEYALERAKTGDFTTGFLKPDWENMQVDIRELFQSVSGRKAWGIELKEFEYQIKSDPEREAKIPNILGLTRLKHIVGPDTAREFLRLPIPHQGYLRTIRLDTEALPRMEDGEREGEGKVETFAWLEDEKGKGAVFPFKPGSIVMGEEKEREGWARISNDDLTRHLFVAGATGSGKTTSLYHLLAQLWHKPFSESDDRESDQNPNIPFLVIEPVKKQYRSLKLLEDHPLRDDLVVFTVGQPRVTPLRFNPFHFGDVTLDEHLAMLETCFRGSMPFFEPLPTLFWNLLEQWHEYESWKGYQRGVDEDGRPVSSERFLSMGKLINHWFEKRTDIMKKIGYGLEVQGNIGGALTARIMEWDRSYIEHIFAPPNMLGDSEKILNLPLEQLLKRPVVLELDALNKDQANLVTLFILGMIREHRKMQGQTGRLRHVVVVEEAHNLVGRSQGPSRGDNVVDPRAAAAEFMVQMLAEVRALGQGLIIVDQTPAAVAPEVLKNTNLKLAQRTTDSEDRNALASNMLLNGVQFEELARLGTGYAYFYQPDLYYPVQLRVKTTQEILELANNSMSDSQLRQRQVEQSLNRLERASAKARTSQQDQDIERKLAWELYMTMLHYHKDEVDLCSYDERKSIERIIKIFLNQISH